MKDHLRMLLLFLCINIGVATAQVSKVSGIVLSAEDNEPIIGASVLVKGTTIGTITDIDGKYAIGDIPATAKTLVISYVGMETEEIPIRAGEQRVIMKSDSKALDEVIVVAYGTQKKSSFTGSASTVGAQTIEKRALTNVISALEGNTTGVQVTSGTGQPGESASLRIRGFGSVNASNNPLYVVDGTVFNGNISDINPTDIEAMTILKDAASTSLYGSSAGNGVVLITTKKGKGKDGATGVTLNINQGWSKRAYNDYARINIWQYYPTQWEMLKNSYITGGKDASEAATLASAKIAGTLKYNPYAGVEDANIVGTDGKLNPSISGLLWGNDLNWEDAAFKTGYRQEYNMSYNTKTAKSDTYASLNYLKDDGYMIKTDFERYSGRINYNIYPVKWFKTGINLNASRTKSNYSTATSGNSSSYSNLTRFVRNMAPIYPIHKHDPKTGAYLDINGQPTTNPKDYVYDYDGNRLSDSGRHGIAEAEWNDRQLVRVTQLGHTYITLTPIEELNATINYSIENRDYRAKVYENPLVGDGTAGPGRLNQTSSRTLTQTFNQLVSYKKSFGLNNFDVLLGHENYSYKYEYLYGMKTKEVVSNIFEFSNFVDISRLNSYTDEYKKEGYFTRINYDYDNKYYASVSYRRDGSSRFSKDNRWGNFWSFGGSWRINEENFMKDLTWINNLKIRASYGQTGNDDILNSDGNSVYYPYMELYELGNNNRDEPGVYFKTMANPNLKWETQISSDVALEFGLFDRLTGSVEYFQKNSKDLLFDVSKPSSSGVTSVIENIGKVKNSGVEIELNYNFVRTKDWSASFGVNATFAKNKIVDLPSTMKENGYVTGSKKWMEGKSIYEFWLRQWYGVNPANGDGLYLLDEAAWNTAMANAEATGNQSTINTLKNAYVELDGKKLTNNYTYALYDFSGTSLPKVYGGFNFNVSYKQFDLSTTFSYQLGGKILDNTYTGLMSMQNFGEALSSDVLDAWKKEGDIASVPRLDNNSTHATNIGQSYSTRWLVKSNYLNLRSLTLGYTFPKQWTEPIMLSNLRINFTGENLFMLKARQGLNPMGNFNGLTYNEYMPSRNFTFGITASF